MPHDNDNFIPCASRTDFQTGRDGAYDTGGGAEKLTGSD